MATRETTATGVLGWIDQRLPVVDVNKPGQYYAPRTLTSVLFGSLARWCWSTRF